MATRAHSTTAPRRRKAAHQLSAASAPQANELDLKGSLRAGLVAEAYAHCSNTAAEAEKDIEAGELNERSRRAADLTARADDMAKGLLLLGAHAPAITEWDAAAKIVFSLLMLRDRQSEMVLTREQEFLVERTLEKRLAPLWAALGVLAREAGWPLLETFHHELSSEEKAIIRGEVEA
ncbi:hypothetical protein HMPREF9946_01543 [Acetobacteraceae bacterium AT-5844]|nr:hypothetical protein HMPREF9946_01543 [Acetobacteraceae bacterium AT-5844]